MLMKFTGLRSSGIIVDSESTDWTWNMGLFPRIIKTVAMAGNREASLMELPASWAEGTKDAAFQERGLFGMQLFWGHLCSCK